jgi:Tfp pilus assembly protein PilN
VIEVNLLPGGKRGKSKGLSFSMPKLSLGGGGGAGGQDPYVIFFAAAAAIAIGYMGWTFMGVRSEAEELQVRLEEERQDSVRFAALIEQTNRLTARRDSIAERVVVIQEMEYTWLQEIIYVSENPLQVRLVGRAGSIFAITNFMSRLESSSFLRDVEPQTIQQQQSETDANDLVQFFELLITYEPPPLDELQTVPLFEDETVSSLIALPGGN